jgi:sterol 3beta-glucosyltransferase
MARRPRHLGSFTPPAGRRIALLTYGSRGDVAPFLALARGLAAAGYSVQVVAPGAYAPLAAAHRIPYRSLPGDPDHLARQLSDHAGLSLPLQVLRMTQHVLPIAAEVMRLVLEVASQADLLVSSFLMAEAGHTAARLSRIPCVSAQLFPVFAPTTAFTAVAYPDLPLGPAYRRATHRLNNLVFRIGGRVMYSRLRFRHPDLPRLAAWPFDGNGDPPTPILFGYSPIVLPPPPDWPSWTRVTGYWALGPAPGWSPPAELERFLRAGSPPIYFGVGSMRPSKLAAAIAATVEAIGAAGGRALVAAPAEAAEAVRLPPTARWIREIPHEWLFPRLGAVIHHGGAGTTGAALRAGVPSLAVPVTADQSFWARRIHALGVGPPPVPISRWSLARATEAIHDLRENSAMAEAARSLSHRLALEHGVETAIEFIQDHLQRSAE